MSSDALAYLDEMNEAGRIEYDDYRNLHDLISGAVEPRPRDVSRHSCCTG